MSTEAILRRFTHNASHPTCAAMLEVMRTVFNASGRPAVVRDRSLGLAGEGPQCS
ncbi:hypothetical protein [Streptomyces sp. NPDC003710]